MALQSLLTSKQQEVLNSYFNDDWKYLILAGAKRSGKTYIDNFIFLYELRRVAELAKKLGDGHPQFILAGFSSNTIYNNVISSIASQFGIDMKADRHGHYHLFGVDIVPSYTGSLRGMSSIRGMTAYGSYINEASLAVHDVFQEILARCSMDSARVICDTNPDNPQHWLKTDYIDNHNPDARIKAFHFTIDDNTFLSAEYVKAFKAATPSGMFYDRDILGLWVTGQGVVYPDFNKQTMVVDEVPDLPHYAVGVDFGFAKSHPAAITVFGYDNWNAYHTKPPRNYLVESYEASGMFIDQIIDILKNIQQRYGRNINVWCDSARPEYVSQLQRAGIHARNAKKVVMSGVEFVAELMKTNCFYVKKSAAKPFLDEVYQYVWNEKTGEPAKDHDHVMDSVRYCLYNQHHTTGATLLPNFMR